MGTITSLYGDSPTPSVSGSAELPSKLTVESSDNGRDTSSAKGRDGLATRPTRRMEYFTADLLEFYDPVTRQFEAPKHWLNGRKPVVGLLCDDIQSTPRREQKVQKSLYRRNINCCAIWKSGNMKEIDLLTTELSGVLPKEEIREAYDYVMKRLLKFQKFPELLEV